MFGGTKGLLHFGALRPLTEADVRGILKLAYRSGRWRHSAGMDGFVFFEGREENDDL